MPPQFQIQVCGDITRGHTIAEIASGQQPVASVFETSAGWQIEVYPADVPCLPLDAFLTVVASAKERLGVYVNRRGQNPPEGLTRAGFSLWLMEKNDGTAMGQTI